MHYWQHLITFMYSSAQTWAWERTLEPYWDTPCPSTSLASYSTWGMQGLSQFVAIKRTTNFLFLSDKAQFGLERQISCSIRGSVQILSRYFMEACLIY